ncbi:hypothetical protein ASU86_00580 [Enterobacter hormaechei subsp. steigerwaltii]|uniref:hypothetical protein n=1 Tax=Enterobacter hormaechei TaxID=158836 RepID=UPI0007354320|nr:hypothetical protein [Enterobacter hormaechei]KTJ33740.1 hypothetical protein ASU86_00580 [Enterobacter hormaechei subsp. steigerwaltii]
MTNVSAVEKMAELMQQMEENSPRVAALQYCLKQVAEKVEDAEKRNAELEARCAALAAENAGMKNGNGTSIEFRDFYAWWNIFNEDGLRSEDERMLAAGAWMARSGLGNTDTYQYVPAVTTATDAFLAEVRVPGVETAIDTAKNVVAQEFQYKDFETAQRVCHKFPESDLVGKVEMVEWLEEFAAQIRKGVQS